MRVQSRKEGMKGEMQRVRMNEQGGGEMSEEKRVALCLPACMHACFVCLSQSPQFVSSLLIQSVFASHLRQLI